MGNADRDLLAFVLRHGELVAHALWEYAERHDGDQAALSAARDVEWLYKVNRRDWSHEVHAADCMDDEAEAHRAGMTEPTVEANHRLHMGHVERIESALRAQR